MHEESTNRRDFANAVISSKRHFLESPVALSWQEEPERGS